MTSPSPQRRHLLVLLVLVAVAAVGAGLVLSDHDRGRHAASTSTSAASTTLPSSPPLRFLGAFADDATLRRYLEGLVPSTLRPPAGTPPTAVTPTSVAGPPDASERDLERCEPTFRHSSDRALGSRLAAAAGRVGAQRVLVVSYRVPASGTQPAGVRVLAADATSCVVRLAIAA